MSKKIPQSDETTVLRYFTIWFAVLALVHVSSRVHIQADIESMPLQIRQSHQRQNAASGTWLRVRSMLPE